MPQLLTEPWFMIFTLTWSIFLMVIPTKIMNYYFNNNPEMISAQNLKTHPWNWEWH